MDVGALPFLLVALHPPAVLLHELGHLAVAWARGFEIRSFSAGALRIHKGPSGTTVRIVPSSLFGRGGVEAIPTRFAGTERDLALFVLGGPAANLVVAVLSGAVCWRGLATEQLSLRDAGDGLLVANALMHLAHAIGTLVPRVDRRSGRPSDGHHLFGLLRGRETTRRRWWKAVLRGAIERAGSVAPAVPRPILDPLLEGGRPGDAFHLFATVAALEQGRRDEARGRLARAAEARTGRPAETLADFAVHEAAFHRLVEPEPAKAEAALAFAVRQLESRPGYLDLLDAVRRSIDGDSAGAARSLTGWEAYLRRQADDRFERALACWIVRAVSDRADGVGAGTGPRASAVLDPSSPPSARARG